MSDTESDSERSYIEELDTTVREREAKTSEKEDSKKRKEISPENRTRQGIQRRRVASLGDIGEKERILTKREIEEVIFTGKKMHRTPPEKREYKKREVEKQVGIDKKEKEKEEMEKVESVAQLYKKMMEWSEDERRREEESKNKMIGIERAIRSIGEDNEKRWKQLERKEEIRKEQEEIKSGVRGPPSGTDFHTRFLKLRV